MIIKGPDLNKHKNSVLISCVVPLFAFSKFMLAIGNDNNRIRFKQAKKLGFDHLSCTFSLQWIR